MKQQHYVHDAATAEYTGGLEHVWSEWEPALRRTERLLHAGGRLYDVDGDGEGTDAADQLRRAQYRAHTASEFTSALQPPVAAADAHAYLVSTLDACRETLGVLAVRAELDELDEQSTGIGLHSVAATREAFRVARSSSVVAYQQFMEHPRPVYVQHMQARGRSTGMVLWSLVGICAILFTVLLYEVFLLTAPA